MAKKRIAISAAGGIQAGSPFAVDEALFVEQASPPFANTWRLGRIVDAARSIVAPGDNAGTSSFIVGPRVVDTVGGDRAVMIGSDLSQSPAGAGLNVDQVIIGNHIQLAAISTNNQGFIGIGTAFTFTAFAAANNVGGSVGIGKNVKFIATNAAGGDASNAVAIGNAAQITAGGGVAIGANAAANETGVAIGQGSHAGVQSVAIGLNADAAADHTVSIGDRARAGTDSVIVGWFADGANSANSMAFGREASVNGRTNAMAFGRETQVNADGLVQFGSKAYPTLYLRFGGGEEDSVGGNTYIFGVTPLFGGAGNNLAGNGLLIQAGAGTGNWANAQNLGIDLQVGQVQAGGSTTQGNVSVLALRHSDLNVSFWGGMAATFGAGKKVMFLGAATTAPSTNPTAGGLLYVTGANNDLFYRNSAGTATQLNGGGGGGLPTSGGTMTGSILVGTDNAFDLGDVTHAWANVYANRVVSDASNTLDLVTTAFEVRLMPLGVQTFSASQSGPDGTKQVYPGATYTSGSGVSLGGPTRAFKGLWVGGAPPITILGATTTVGASVGTLSNCPTAGNPTGYLQLSVNGAIAKIPYWT